jgi:transcriptional antiterminator RfaH
MSAFWFAVQTQPRAEERAKWHLENQNIITYLPLYRRPVRHARRVAIALRPLFPGYLFVHLDPEVCRWRSINGTVGVRQILTDGLVPLPLPDRVIDEIKARQDETGAVKLRATFKPGQTVRLVQGALANIDALFEEIRDEDRVILLVSLLGRKVRMQVPAEVVTAA